MWQKRHLCGLIKEPEYRRTVMDIIAYLVQRPGEKIMWALLIQGVEGCGIEGGLTGRAMTIDLIGFTPLAALAGGVLIGLAAAMFVLFNGRIAGISGIVGGLLRPKEGDVSWRLAFVIGLIAAPVTYQLFAALPASRIDASDTVLVIAGVLVGVSTRYGAGCTSGHGVCGLSRLSARSLVATLLFMGAGFATVFVMRHGGV